MEHVVTVLLSNWNKEPVIGIIKEGTYFGSWIPQNEIRSTEPWIEKLPKECIIIHSFDLSSDMKLQLSTRKHLKNKYALLKKQCKQQESLVRSSDFKA